MTIHSISCTGPPNPLAGQAPLTLGRTAPRRVLIELIGFQNTFLVTAGIKALSFVPLVALLFLLDEGLPCCQLWVRRVTQGARMGAPAAAAGDVVDPLQAPLLAGVDPDQARTEDETAATARSAK